MASSKSDLNELFGPDSDSDDLGNVSEQGEDEYDNDVIDDEKSDKLTKHNKRKPIDDGVSNDNSTKKRKLIKKKTRDDNITAVSNKTKESNDFIVEDEVDNDNNSPENYGSDVHSDSDVGEAGNSDEDRGIDETANHQRPAFDEAQESDGDEDEGKSEFDKVLSSIKKKGRGKASEKSYPEKMYAANLFLKKMDQAAKEDEELNRLKKPATKKMSMLKEVVENASKIEMIEPLLDAGFLHVIRTWLTPLPNGSLPALDIRTALLNILLSMEVDELFLEKLNTAHLGVPIVELFRHSKETAENKNLELKLIEKWSRPIYRLDTDYRAVAPEIEDKSSALKRWKETEPTNAEGKRSKVSGGNMDIVKRRRDDLDLELDRRHHSIPSNSELANRKHAEIPAPVRMDFAVRPAPRIPRPVDFGKKVSLAKDEIQAKHRITKRITQKTVNRASSDRAVNVNHKDL